MAQLQKFILCISSDVFSVAASNCISSKNSIRFLTTSSDASTCVSSLGVVTGSGASQSVLGSNLMDNTIHSFNINCSDEVGNNGTATSTFTTDAFVSTGGGSTVSGCTDSSACNYDSSATSDDSSCTYADLYYDCNNVCLSDTDGDGICDQMEEDDLGDGTSSEEEGESESGTDSEVEIGSELEEETGAEEVKGFLGVRSPYWWIISLAIVFAIVYFSFNKKKK